MYAYKCVGGIFVRVNKSEFLFMLPQPCQHQNGP